MDALAVVLAVPVSDSDSHRFVSVFYSRNLQVVGNVYNTIGAFSLGYGCYCYYCYHSYQTFTNNNVRVIEYPRKGLYRFVKRMEWNGMEWNGMEWNGM